MTTLLFILGHTCSGKTYLSKEWIKSRLPEECWTLMDKDTIGNVFSMAYMKQLGLNSNDRDSPTYKELVRDLEYNSCLEVIREQLELGINVVAPGPWTKEINNGTIFSHKKLNISNKIKLRYVYLDISLQLIKKRLLKRNHPRDDWKLKNWDYFSQNLTIPKKIYSHNITIFRDNNYQKQENILKLLCE